jgi:hypothetical protein
MRCMACQLQILAIRQVCEASASARMKYAAVLKPRAAAAVTYEHIEGLYC